MLLNPHYILSTSLVSCILCHTVMNPPTLYIWSSQDLSPLACGKVSHHHTSTECPGAWLSTCWPPESLKTGSVGVHIQLGKAGMLGSDWEMEYTLHHGNGGWGSVCSPFSFLFGRACGTENANFSQLKANTESSYFVLWKSRASWLGIQIPGNPVSLKGQVLNMCCKWLDGKLQTADYCHDLFSKSLRRYLNNWRSWWFARSQWDHGVQFSHWLITMNPPGLEWGHFAQCFTAGRS